MIQVKRGRPQRKRPFPDQRPFGGREVQKAWSGKGLSSAVYTPSMEDGCTKKRDPRPSHPYHVRGSQLGHPIALAEYTTSYSFCQQGFRAEQTGSRPGRPRPCCALSRSVPAALYPDASKKTRRLREVRVEHPGSNRHREKSPPENGTSPAGSDPAGLLCVAYVYGDPEGSRTPVAGLKARCPNR